MTNLKNKIFILSFWVLPFYSQSLSTIEHEQTSHLYKTLLRNSTSFHTGLTHRSQILSSSILFLGKTDINNCAYTRRRFRSKWPFSVKIKTHQCFFAWKSFQKAGTFLFEFAGCIRACKRVGNLYQIEGIERQILINNQNFRRFKESFIRRKV